jgi:hypothetical protein
MRLLAASVCPSMQCAQIFSRTATPCPARRHRRVPADLLRQSLDGETGEFPVIAKTSQSGQNCEVFAIMMGRYLMRMFQPTSMTLTLVIMWGFSAAMACTVVP